MPLSTTRLTLLAAALVSAAALGGCDRGAGGSEQPAAKEGAGSATAGDGLGEHRTLTDRAGRPLPAAQVVAPDGRPAALASLRGKPVLVNLWATWCAPCLAELPTLNRLATEMEGRAHVVALAQDVNATHTATRDFLKQRGWETIASWSDSENKVGLEEGGNLPTTILYDASGKETARVVGPLDWYSAEARELLRAAGFPPVEE